MSCSVFVYAANESYSMPLGTSIKSLVDTSLQPGGGTILVIDCGLSDLSRDRLRACVTDEWELRFRELPDGWCANLPDPGRFTRAAYGRLFIDLVAPDSSRAIYLDADTVIIRPIDELLHLDLKGVIAAGVQDEYIPSIGSPEGIADWSRFGLDPREPYFNSGVLVIDLREWRRCGVAAKALGYLKSARPGIELIDQEALNYALYGRWRLLPVHWNVGRYWYRGERRQGCFRDLVSRARILHYTTEYKPWSLPHKVPGWSRQPFFHFLDRTPWAGWRPAGYEEARE